MSFILKAGPSLKRSIVNMFYEYNVEPRSYGYQFVNFSPIIVKRGNSITKYNFNKIRVAYKKNGWEVTELKCGNVSPTTIHDGELVQDVEVGDPY